MKRIYPGILLAGVLVLCLSGGAVAASQITGGDIKNSTITGKDIRNRSLTKSDFKGSLPRGPQGPQGPPGPNVVGQSTLVSSGEVPFTTDIVQLAVATCPTGYRVIGGGGVSVSSDLLAASLPSADRTSWGVIGVDQSGDPTAYVEAEAICAPAGRAVVASARKSTARKQFEKMADKIAAQHAD